MIDWTSVTLSLLKTLKKSAPDIQDTHLFIKPRLFQDDNQLRALSALRTVLAFIPSAQIASSVLGLGETGFKIWKAISLRKEYDALLFPVIGINSLIFLIRNDAVLKTHFEFLVEERRWAELQKVYEDFSFITSPTVLKEKYPKVPQKDIDKKTEVNKSLLERELETIEQEIIKRKSIPEIEANLREALEALKGIFPAMRDWSLINSENFNEVLEIVDTLV